MQKTDDRRQMTDDRGKSFQVDLKFTAKPVTRNPKREQLSVTRHRRPETSNRSPVTKSILNSRPAGRQAIFNREQENSKYVDTLSNFI